MEEQALIYSALASDEDFREIVEMFVDEMQGRIQRFETAFAAKNWADLQIAAHQLKGSAGGYGFMPVSEAAAALNELLKNNASETEIETAMNALIAVCRRITAKPSVAEATEGSFANV
ncbi:MAG: Hpt domain-containing protein [Planctomycetaceae bacterium]|jgi:HPt (histidine-containing phosphotransfer) domain-containing protein|nr:Hpt domain-containing protein [Planctomycetaceae bacterium]